MKVKRALLSVSDKTGIVELGKALAELGIEIISTGGTMRALRDAGVPVMAVQDVTGFPEMMDGRVKTLHPKIHGAILAVRDNPSHVQDMKDHDITPIDLVVVNLYPFQQTIAKPDVTLPEAIENIDIGGPCMVRASAKNNKYVAIVTNPKKYGEIVDILKKNGEFTDAYRLELAREAFQHTAQYDTAIAAYLTEQVEKGDAK
ncbi:IMP cyclohydrolase [Megasphaera hominis]|jgi:AICAR transformylase/IMP cyclohydrolase PurH|uniref:IMP cyclohydrolase n=1 Tax=Megasphaera hominis TaxID=159836 RepID=A0ABR6VEV6_9FIRM|nr:IMP cyclohydrolase [Megasphaera hominis]MBC3535782.1 IMP cyclohydrolase [Megasphaera hominis]